MVLEMSVPKLRRVDRPISVSAVLAGPSIDIWRSCRFLGAMIGALVDCLVVLVGSFHVAQVPITVGSGLLVGRSVVMVLRLGLQGLLVLASWMTYFLSLVTHLGLVGPSLTVLLGCGVVPPPFFSSKKLLGSCRPAGSWFARFWRHS